MPNFTGREFAHLRTPGLSTAGTHHSALSALASGMLDDCGVNENVRSLTHSLRDDEWFVCGSTECHDPPSIVSCGGERQSADWVPSLSMSFTESVCALCAESCSKNRRKCKTYNCRTERPFVDEVHNRHSARPGEDGGGRLRVWFRAELGGQARCRCNDALCSRLRAGSDQGRTDRRCLWCTGVPASTQVFCVGDSGATAAKGCAGDREEGRCRLQEEWEQPSPSRESADSRRDA